MGAPGTAGPGSGPDARKARPVVPTPTSLVAILVVVILLGLPALALTSAGPLRSTGGTVRAVPVQGLRAAPTESGVRATAALSSSMSWTPLSPPAPNAASGAGLATLANEGVGVWFGGDEAGGLANGTLLYNESENTWTPLTPLSAPSPRSDFGFAANDNGSGTAVLFGGELNLSTGATDNETWIFHFAGRDWTNASGSVAPAPREDPGFAVDPSDQVALLYGGYGVNSDGTGEITYSDTWELNLSNDAWSRVDIGGTGPGPLRGASLVWQPSLGSFVLTGGCFPCSSQVWAFSPGSRTWSLLDGIGAVPAPRMDASFVWDPAAGVDVLFGGTNGTGVFNDTHYLDPTDLVWTSARTNPSPSPRWGSAAGFLNAPDNATVLLAGGTAGSGPISDTWRLSEDATVLARLTNASSGAGIASQPISVGTVSEMTNATGYATVGSLPATETTIAANIPGYAARNVSLWLPPGTTVNVTLVLPPLSPATLVVHVSSPGVPDLIGAQVNVSIGGRPVAGSPKVTTSTGTVTFADLPSSNATVSVSHSGFHPNSTRVDLPPGQQTQVGVVLDPLSYVEIQVLGKFPNATLPLRDAQVTVGGDLEGVTDPAGWINFTTPFVGLTAVTVWAYGYLNSSGSVLILATGITVQTITLRAEPSPRITVEVLGRSIGHLEVLLDGASVNVTSVGALPSGPYYGNFSTGTTGGFVFSPPVGNYTFRASAAGYVENSSGSVLTTAAGAQYVRTIYLSPIGLSNVSVLVLSSAPGHAAISRATVQLNSSGLNVTDGAPYTPKVRTSLADGWANFSGVPATLTNLTASASGYLSNSSTYALSYNPRGYVFTIYLTPLPPPPYSGLRILPANIPTGWALAFIPAAALLGALVYLTVLRTPSSRTDEAVRSRSTAGPTGPDRSP